MIFYNRNLFVLCLQSLIFRYDHIVFLGSVVGKIERDLPPPDVYNFGKFSVCVKVIAVFFFKL